MELVIKVPYHKIVFQISIESLRTSRTQKHASLMEEAADPACSFQTERNIYRDSFYIHRTLG